MTYESPAALRQSLDDRVRREHRENGVDATGLRQAIVFERVLARLVHANPDGWVLKGGVALQVRMPARARATRDLDLAVRGDLAGESTLRETLVDSLASDIDGDQFRLSLLRMTSLPPLEAGRTGWRLSIRANLDAREFATVRADVVARTTETGRTERRRLPSALAFAGIPDVEIDVVDLDHHFAEKLAAYTADRGDRENTRVKDLTDLVLLVETGLEPTHRLREVVEVVFAERNETPPVAVPAPPMSWGATYSSQAAAIELEARTLDEAHRVVHEFWFATAEEIV